LPTRGKMCHRLPSGSQQDYLDQRPPIVMIVRFKETRKQQDQCIETVGG
jgi:hypothetical protein